MGVPTPVLAYHVCIVYPGVNKLRAFERSRLIAVDCAKLESNTAVMMRVLQIGVLWSMEALWS